MPLDSEQIKNLLHKQETKTLAKPPEDKKRRQREIEIIQARSTKLIRRATQYPTLPSDGPVTRHDSFPTLRCASRGCSSPTCYKYSGVPYCSIHLITFLSMDIAELRRGVNSANGNSYDHQAYYDDRDTSDTDYF